jgi:hypothetical protein
MSDLCDMRVLGSAHVVERSCKISENEARNIWMEALLTTAVNACQYFTSFSSLVSQISLHGRLFRRCRFKLISIVNRVSHFYSISHYNSTAHF